MFVLVREIGHPEDDRTGYTAWSHYEYEALSIKSTTARTDGNSSTAAARGDRQCPTQQRGNISSSLSAVVYRRSQILDLEEFEVKRRDVHGGR